MDIPSLLIVSRCVDCGADGLMPSSSATVACRACGREYTATQGIFDFRPRADSLPSPRMYDDEHLRAWNESLAENQDFFYRENSLVRWVQESGHVRVRRLSRRTQSGLTLDLACGDGAHRPFLDDVSNVIGLDLHQRSLLTLREQHPDYFAIRGDAYRLPLADRTVARVISVYGLEHLLHLDFLLEEVRRVLIDDGEFMVSVPTEGGWAWNFGRSISSKRRFNSDGLDYDRVISLEHCNCVWQVARSLERHFLIDRTSYFPWSVPSYHLNLTVTWRLRKRPESQTAAVAATPKRLAA